jgi:hypothetical protein
MECPLRCCCNPKPINIGILSEKWICKTCDSDLETTEHKGVFKPAVKDPDQEFKISTYNDPVWKFTDQGGYVVQGTSTYTPPRQKWSSPQKLLKYGWTFDSLHKDFHGISVMKWTTVVKVNSVPYVISGYIPLYGEGKSLTESEAALVKDSDILWLTKENVEEEV